MFPPSVRSLLHSSLSAVRRHRRAQRRPERQRRLSLEPLETRWLLATLDVGPGQTHQTLNAGTRSLQITFSEPVLDAGLAANYQLQSLGPDALLGTADDTVIPISASYAGTTATLSFAALPENVYRLPGAPEAPAEAPRSRLAVECPRPGVSAIFRDPRRTGAPVSAEYASTTRAGVGLIPSWHRPAYAPPLARPRGTPHRSPSRPRCNHPDSDVKRKMAKAGKMSNK
jgi:hypothetical protein